MNYLLRSLLILVISSGSMVIWAAPASEAGKEKNYFQFVIAKYHTSRQGGQTVDIYARYAYRKDLPINEYPDYRLLRTAILKYMEPSNELPAEVFWEILATHMGRELIRDYPLEGLSIQLNVLDNPNPDSYEPGNHGPVYTIGKIAPLDVH